MRRNQRSKQSTYYRRHAALHLVVTAWPDDREARNRPQSDSIATVTLCCRKSPDCRALRAPGCITCAAQWAKPRIVMQPAIMVFVCRTSHPPIMSRMSEVRGVPDPFRNMHARPRCCLLARSWDSALQAAAGGGSKGYRPYSLGSGCQLFASLRVAALPLRSQARHPATAPLSKRRGLPSSCASSV